MLLVFNALGTSDAKNDEINDDSGIKPHKATRAAGLGDDPFFSVRTGLTGLCGTLAVAA